MPSDYPWKQSPPPPGSDDGQQLRYKRSLALNEMAWFVGRFANHPRYAERVAYRRHCMEHWQAYLDGAIDAPTGRKMRRGPPPLPENERYVPWNVTLPPRLSERLMAQLAPDETKSALLTRLLEQVI